MKTSRALRLVWLLVAAPLGAVAGGTVRPPDPVGEAVYRAHLWASLQPLEMIAGAALLAVAIVACYRHISRHSD